MTKELEAKVKAINALEKENKMLVEMNQILREGMRRNSTTQSSVKPPVDHDQVTDKQRDCSDKIDT